MVAGSRRSRRPHPERGYMLPSVILLVWINACFISAIDIQGWLVGLRSYDPEDVDSFTLENVQSACAQNPLETTVTDDIEFKGSKIKHSWPHLVDPVHGGQPHDYFCLTAISDVYFPTDSDYNIRLTITGSAKLDIDGNTVRFRNKRKLYDLHLLHGQYILQSNEYVRFRKCLWTVPVLAARQLHQ